MFSRLFELIRKEDIVLFIGAGFSLKAGYPGGNRLAEIIYNDLTNTEKTHINPNIGLMDLAEEYIQIRHGSRNSLIQILKNEFSKNPLDLTSHNLIASIPHFHDIITTNYDTLFEQVYKSDCNVIVSDANCPYIDEQKVNIFKIHGNITQPDSIIISKSDYTRYFDTIRNPVMWNYVRSLFATKSVLFIGYGYEDGNIESIFTKLLESIGDNRKEIFLIAPNIPSHKVERLHRYRINYFDSTGEIFLDALINNIKQNIVKDFKEKRVTTETYSKFCRNNGLEVSILPKEDKNIILSINPISEYPAKSQISFTVPNELKDKIFNPKYKQYNKELKEINGIKFSEMPSLKLEKNELIDYFYSANDITFSTKDEISALYIVDYPQKKGYISIHTQNAQYYSNMKYEIYKVDNETLNMKIRTPLYTYEIIINIDRINNKYNFTGNPQFTDYYSNKYEAIYWMNLLVYLCTGNNIEVIIDDKTITISPNVNKQGELLYRKGIEYYEIIDQIEKITHRKFKKHKNINNERYDKAQKVLHFLNQKAIIIPPIECKDLTFEVEPNSSIIKDYQNDNNNKYAMAFSRDIPSIKLNDEIFKIGFENVLYKSCIVSSCKLLSNGNYSITVHNEEDAQILYSTESIRQENQTLYLK